MTRKRKEFPILENITITDVAAEGKALARVDDMVVFVPFVVPGDVVDLKIQKKKHHYCEATAVKFHQYSPLRAVPFCPHFGVCGGCKWQCLPYKEQLKYKQQQVLDNLTRIGKVELNGVQPIPEQVGIRFFKQEMAYTGRNRIRKRIYAERSRRIPHQRFVRQDFAHRTVPPDG